MAAAELERCVRAATAVAREHGLGVDDAVRLRESSNVLLHLRPFPVVARVMTATVGLHEDPAAWLTREVAVGAHLRELGAPATCPTTLLPAGPHLRDGLWITFWDLVAETPQAGRPEPGRLGASLRALHDALRSYAGPGLPALSAVVDHLDGLLRGLRPAPWFRAERIADARRELERRAPLLDETAEDRPIHGDASISNVLETPGGLVWNDFEDACRGPVEWDVAGLLLDLQDRARTARVPGGNAATSGAMARSGGSGSGGSESVTPGSGESGSGGSESAGSGSGGSESALPFLAAYGDHRRDLVDELLGLHRLYAIAWHASRAADHPRSRRRLDEHLAARARDVGA